MQACDRFAASVRAVFFVLLAQFSLPWLADAQTPPPHMCGSGEFTVSLPAVSFSVANAGIYNFALSGSGTPPADSITLPKGCPIYALLVGGFDQNYDLDRIVFYKLAEFVAQKGGYVHVAWWNNLLKPYLAGPLHDTSVTVDPPFLSGPNYTLHTTPGIRDRFTSAPQTQLLFLPTSFTNHPKALPVEDFQFQADAAAFIRAIRSNHDPDPFIVVAGHGMGGASAARLLSEKADLIVDLLAVVDPVGNRDRPIDPGAELMSADDTGKLLNLASVKSGVHFNWTRNRAANVFKGYRQWDCLRGPLGFCIPVGSHLANGLGTRCAPVDPYLNAFPDIATKTFRCPVLVPDIHPGAQMVFKSNVRRLYHRWQKEYFGPADYWWPEERLFRHPGTHSRTDIQQSNFQAPIGTCKTGQDPSDPSIECSLFDGHGELVGMRGGDFLGIGRTFPGLQLVNWPDAADQRRAQFAEMKNGAAWPHRPVNPNLCTVCENLIDIIEPWFPPVPTPGTSPGPAPDLVAPTSTASLAPEANEAGWHKEDIAVNIIAADNVGGSGVKQIHVALTGAQTTNATIEGDSADATVTEEGTTTITFFARDNQGHEETPQTITAKVDKVEPEVEPAVSPAPNAAGWHKSDVTVSFTASDELSGVIEMSNAGPVVVTTEGTLQPVVATATDEAGNVGSFTVDLNIDKTAPVVDGAVDRAPDHNGWYKHAFTIEWSCTDGLSGVESSASPTAYAGPDAAGGTREVTCLDRAGNDATASVSFNFDATPPAITFGGASPLANAAGWYRTDVTLSWNCADATSGPEAPSVSATINGEGAGLAASAACQDIAGHSTLGTRSGINIDRTPPTVNIASPADAGAYLLNANVASSFSCGDALSGLHECSGPAASGSPVDTSRVGNQTFAVNALDVAGNATTRTHSYGVRYQFSGFLSPVRVAPGFNLVNAGRTIPLKYQLRDAHGALIEDIGSFGSIDVVPVPCNSATPATELPEGGEFAANSTVQYVTDHFQLNWKTSQSFTGCHALQLRLADGTTHLALFQFK